MKNFVSDTAGPLALAGLILGSFRSVGSAQDHVVPPAGHEKKMVNAGIKVMPRPKAWDDINTPLTASVTAANPLEVTICTSYRSPFAYLGMDRYAATRAGLQREGRRQVRLPDRDSRPRPSSRKLPTTATSTTRTTWSVSPSAAGIPYHVDFSGKTWRDPIVIGGNLIEIAPRDEQIYIYPLYAVSTLMQTEHPDKNLAFAPANVPQDLRRNRVDDLARRNG